MIAINLQYYKEGCADRCSPLLVSTTSIAVSCCVTLSKHPNKGNHPNKADLYIAFLRVNFAVKNAMFNLNENNNIVIAQHPSDMRIGVNGMCGQVRSVGLDPTDGNVYIFVGKSRNIMKILHWERGGYTMYYKRLEQGRFHPRIFLRQGIGFRSLRWDELVLLMEGISPKAARRHRYEKEENNSKNEVKKSRKIWLSR